MDGALLPHVAARVAQGILSNGFVIRKEFKANLHEADGDSAKAWDYTVGNVVKTSVRMAKAILSEIENETENKPEIPYNNE